ncbi:MAG: DUF4968 domain-containing protein, partial [Bacteroidia bacterium]|nr:DUF4968 domain-containing protein [Bacteroidia bacterium]
MSKLKTYQLFFILGFLSFCQSIVGQVTFVINELPIDHDYTNSIYISGDFEGWSGGSEAYKLTRKDNTYSITLDVNNDVFLYKFTRGSWETVERTAEGDNTENRIYKRSSGEDTVYVKIVNWKKRTDSTEGKSTAAKNVTILSENFDIPELDRSRRIWMYLPPDYYTSGEDYPVLYIHDGQNVFDALTSYAGEWGVDETLNRLFRSHNFKLIVVGIDNGGEKRMNEYSPWENHRFGEAEGGAYVNFIAKTLKPHIDDNFRTLKDSKNTGIMGSSMGGLISHYAALKYPNIFGKAGVFSPSFWYSEQSFDFTAQHLDKSDLKMYFLVGGKEGESMVPDMTRMVDLMKQGGYGNEQIKKKIVEEGIHNEKFWQDEFEEAILWLFPHAVKKREFVNAELNESNQLDIMVSDGKYRIQFYSSEIVETTFIPTGQAYKEESHAVSMLPIKGITYDFKSETNSISYGSSALKVKITKSPFQISYFKDGTLITAEKSGYQRNDEFETISLS